MDKKIAVFPGSFDPLTLGHLDVIQRGITLFDRLIIAIGVNTDKKYMFSLEERLEILRETFKDEHKISVHTYSGLTVDFCKDIKANFILRGLRNPADFEFEKSVAQMNRRLSGFETVFLLTSAGHAFISSSIVREIMLHKGDFSSLVPKAVKLK